MGVRTPTYKEYIDSATEVKGFFNKHGIDYCIYGSFLVPEKVRKGLSDIDIFTIHPTPDLIFPMSITREFSKVKDSISSLGIPLQINWTTQGQLKNRFLSPDGNYLFEVKKGIGGDYVSQNFSQLLSATNTRDGNEDDKNMARYFHRKMAGLGVVLADTSKLLEKGEPEVTILDQEEIWKLWDGFKKIITFIGAVLRVKTGESLFGLSDKELVTRFNKEFENATIEIDDFLEVMTRVQTIKDWYDFLKAEGIEKIQDIYSKFTNQIFRAVGNNF